jgi:Flp pilus assembly protein TadD
VATPSRSLLSPAFAIPAFALILIAIAFHQAGSAGFVYDDQTQILQNSYIQDSHRFWKSMEVDVWAFRGDKGEPWSNYWRPIFVAWLHLNHRLFAFRPAGWHWANVLAHAMATFLLFQLLLRLEVSTAVQAITTWGFAVHPVHVQSVTWISGIPDVLMTIFVLGSTLLFLRARDSKSRAAFAGALALFAAALLSKETAIVFPFALLAVDALTARDSRLAIARRFFPFVVVVIAYLAVRTSILGSLRELAPLAPSFGGMLLSVPESLAFYLRQSLLPFQLGPIYPLRPVTAGTIGPSNFFLPLAFVSAVFVACWFLARRSRIVILGALWFLAFIGLALDIRVFLPELMVQDRYLYLPVFGVLLVLSIALERLTRHGVVLGFVLALAMTFQTIAYNESWMNEVALWERGVAVDPSSAIAFTHLGEAYRHDGRLPDARIAMQKALAINPDMTVANIAMGALEIREGRYSEAETYLRRVLAVYPDYAAALEQLGLAYMQQKKFDEAISLMRQGSRAMPYNATRYGLNVAVLYRVSGRPAEARAELESLRPAFAAATDPQLVIGWYYLADLAREEGRMENAKADYVRYLRATDSIRDDAAVAQRREEIHSYGLR